MMTRPSQQAGHAGLTRGSLALREAGRTMDIAQATGISANRIASFKTGQRCPTRVQKQRLEKFLQIPQNLWSEVAQ